MALAQCLCCTWSTQSLSNDIAHDIKEIHKFVYNYLLFFVPLHITGVIIAENSDESGLISTMINGKES